MQKVDVALIAGIAGFLLGGGSVFFAASQSKVARDAAEGAASTLEFDKEALATMTSRQDQFDESLKTLGKRVGRSDADPAKLWDAVKVLQAKVDALEQGKVAALPKDDAVAEPPKDATGGDEFDALQKKMLSGEATADEMAKFWAMLREKPAILADWMKQLEKAVADNPRDAAARMKLAQTYVVKLLTVPAGPEQGAWSMKAMDQYKKVLEQDPNHWGARFHLAFNYSQWPDFLNKTPDAIREFETLRKIQETQTPDAEHAQTYLQLSKLYQKTGKTDAAKQALEEGARRFPDDEELKKALDATK